LIRCTKFSAIERGALRGFADLDLDSGLTIHDCTLMESNGRRWVGLPGKPQINTDKTVRTDPATGKTLYVPVISIADKARRELFSNNALAAIDAFRGESTR
jgi:hypothetical protein